MACGLRCVGGGRSSQLTGNACRQPVGCVCQTSIKQLLGGLHSLHRLLHHAGRRLLGADIRHRRQVISRPLHLAVALGQLGLVQQIGRGIVPEELDGV